jgi:hypothetical protein
MKRMILFVVSCFMIFAATGQQLFEGKITYEFSLLGEGTEAYSMFMPTSMTIDALKGNSNVELQGGFTAGIGRNFTNIKKNKTYRVVDEEETVYESTIEETSPTNQTIVKLNETATIAGFICEKYAITQIVDGNSSISYVWVNTDFYMTATTNRNGGLGGLLAINGVPGLCLKVESVSEGITVSITATDVSFEKPSKNLFKLPKKYKVVPETSIGM